MLNTNLLKCDRKKVLPTPVLIYIKVVFKHENATNSLQQKYYLLQLTNQHKSLYRRIHFYINFFPTDMLQLYPRVGGNQIKIDFLLV